MTASVNPTSPLTMCYPDSKSHKDSADWIHKTAANIKKDPLVYDEANIRDELSMVIKNLAGLLTLKEAVDINGKAIDSKVVKYEFKVLTSDVKKIIETVEDTWNTDKGLERWGRDENPRVQGSGISLASEVEQLRQMFKLSRERAAQKL